MGASEQLTAFINSAVQGLTKKPEHVKIEPVDSGGKNLCVIIHCHADDLSLVIGSHGRNIRALRDLTWAIGAKLGVKVTLIINE